MATAITKNLFNMMDAYYRNYAKGAVSDVADVMRATGVVSTTTTNYRQAIYGRKLFYQVNLESNLYGVFPKPDWGMTGWRALTGYSRSLGSGGIGETAALPTETYPPSDIMSPSPKLVALKFKLSTMSEIMSRYDDSILLPDEIKTYMAAEFRKEINKELAASITSTTGNNLENLDRAISSYDEVTNCGDVLAGQSDIYGKDRDAAATWYDSYVNHNSDTNRALTAAIIQTTMTQLAINGSNKKGDVIITGDDTRDKIVNLFTELNQYVPTSETKVSFGVNGIETDTGLDYGTKVASIYGLPIITSNDLPKDGISRIFVLNLSDNAGNPIVELAHAAYPSYIDGNIPVYNDSLTRVGLYWMIGELRVRNFKFQAKIRDLA